MRPIIDWSRFDPLQVLADPLQLLPATQRAVLRRCATVRRFDRELYEQVLAAGVAGPGMTGGVPAFDALGGNPYVEPLSALPGFFQVRGSYRGDLFRSWWSPGTLPMTGAAAGDPPPASGASAPQNPAENISIPPELAALSAALVAYYRKRGAELDELYHLLLADRPLAAATFDRLYGAAEERFDLSRCYEILSTMEDRQAVLGAVMATLVSQKRRRLQTRSMWAREYYDTTVYLDRESVLATTRSRAGDYKEGERLYPEGMTRPLFAELTSGKHYWALHIYAPGGMGKTMFLRALIARYCVPAGIPCARIDFDYVPHLANAAREPWRLLLRMAQQLNVQMERQPFKELLDTYVRYIAEADGRPIQQPRDPVPAPSPARQRQAMLRLGDTLARNATGPVLVVFDTLENLRAPQVDISELFTLIDELHDRCPSLRVVLSGRYDLRQPVPQVAGEAAAQAIPAGTGFVERFGDEAYTVRLDPFSEEEARRFLEVKRGLAGDPRLDAMIDKCQGNPFKLALLADIVQATPDLTAGEIAQYAQVDLVYLIERVVRRIPDATVRWLLRYGVVPRLLTQDFAATVIGPFLAQSLAGQTDEDDPWSDPLPPAVLAQQPFPVTGPSAAPPDIAKAWASLYPYTGRFSWVSSAPDVPDALVFHPDVVLPMRYLLRDKPRYRQLNQAAAAYYRELAGHEGVKRGAALREAVYHKFESGDADAGATWQAEMAAAGADAELAVALAEEALYGPATSGSGDRLGPQVRALANYELAYRRVAVTETLDQAGWFQVEQWLAEVRRLNPQAAPFIAPGRVAYLQARLAEGRNESAHARAFCDAGLAQPADAANELDLRILRARLLTAGHEDDAALDEFHKALALATGDNRRRVIDIAPRMANALVLGERYDDAVLAYRLLFDEAVATGDIKALGETLVALLTVRVNMGHEAAAIAVGERGLRLIPNLALSPEAVYAPAIARLRAETELARQQPEAAAAALAQLADWNGDPNQALNSDWREVETDLRARIAVARLDVRTAAGEYEKLAYDVYGTSSEYGAEPLMSCAWVYMDLAGDYRQAAHYLDLASSRFVLNRRAQIVWDILNAGRLDRSGDRDAAAASLARLQARIDLPLDMQVFVALEAALLAGGTAETIERLNAALVPVSPPERRLTLVDELRRCPSVGEDARGPALRLLELVSGAGGPELDTALANLRLAEVQRVAGDILAARAALDRAEQAGRDPLRLTLLREIYRGHDRLGWELGRLAALTLPDRTGPGWGKSPELCGLILLEHAERLFTVLQDATGAAALLAEAESLLGGPASLWSARQAALAARLAFWRGEYATGAAEGARAAGLYDALGDAPSAAGLRAELGRPMSKEIVIPGGQDTKAPDHVDAPQVVTGEEPEASPLDIRIQKGRAGGWSVTCQFGNGARLAHEVPASGEIQDLLGTLPDESTGYAFARAFANEWIRIGAGLAEVFLSSEVRDLLAQADSRYDVRWEFADRGLAWLPWEFLRLNSDSPPFVTGPVCRGFFRRVVRQAPPPPAQPVAGIRVLLVRAGQALEAQSQRGLETISGYGLYQQYASHGLQVEQLEHPELEMLMEGLVRSAPRILHIEAGFLDTGQPLLDLGGDAGPISKGYRPRTGQFSAADLGRALSKAPLPPLVILDAPTPPGLEECVRQLCLRNAFAAELSGMGAVSAVLGTGLGNSFTQSDLSDLLVSRLADGAALAEVLHRIWARGLADGQAPRSAQAGGALEDLLPYVGSALFTNAPEQRLIGQES